MTILVSSVGDTIINMLQKRAGKRQAEDDRFIEGAIERHPTAERVERAYIPSNNRVYLDPETQTGTVSELADLVQNKLPQDLVMLSDKLMK